MIIIIITSLPANKESASHTEKCAGGDPQKRGDLSCSPAFSLLEAQWASYCRIIGVTRHQEPLRLYGDDAPHLDWTAVAARG